MEAPKIVSAQPLEDARLLVKFANNVEKIYDCRPLIQKFASFRVLGTAALFKQVKVDPGGYGISWNDEVDLSEYELWTNAVEVITA